MEKTVVSLLGLMAIVLLAIYWTQWKLRTELNQNMEKVTSELSKINKSLEKKTD